MKYRLIEKQRADGSITWHIQKKFFGIWFPYKSKYGHPETFFLYDKAIEEIDLAIKKDEFDIVVKKTVIK